MSMIQGPSEKFDSNPFRQFEKWWQEALRTKTEPQPDAITLATATKSGKPSARIVLFKALEDGAFQFYTNYNSHKGSELSENPRAAIIFFWSTLTRQIRIEGRVKKLTAKQSDAYWATRPRESQLSGSASDQSAEIASYETLKAKVGKLALDLGSHAVPRPKNWGGYGLEPRTIEFWQGMPSRLHFRLLYSKGSNGKWKTKILSP